MADKKKNRSLRAKMQFERLIRLNFPEATAEVRLQREWQAYLRECTSVLYPRGCRAFPRHQERG